MRKGVVPPCSVNEERVAEIYQDRDGAHSEEVGVYWTSSLR